MEIKGEHQIPAHRAAVWDALNDAQTLQACIPGCLSLEKVSDTELTAHMQAKVGPVKAKFSTVIRLSDLRPPNGYTISGEGKGGPAGFAKGSAEVVLEECGEHTVLRYVANLQVGGKLAQVGSRLINGSAKKIAGQFFTQFSALVGEASPASAD